MNRSGEIIPGLLKRAGIPLSNMVVVCDNLDLAAGICRLKRRGGDAGHNGLKSIISRIGSSEFPRLYIGVGHPGSRDGVVDWVLGEPDTQDAGKIDVSVQSAVSSVYKLLTGTVEQVMNELNRRN